MDIFNNFVSTTNPILNVSVSPVTGIKLEFFIISRKSIWEPIHSLNEKMSVQMIKLCGDTIHLLLHVIHGNIMDNRISIDQWKIANLDTVHKQKNISTNNNKSITLLPVFATLFENIYSIIT